MSPTERKAMIRKLFLYLVDRSPNHPKPIPVLAFWRVPSEAHTEARTGS